MLHYGLDEELFQRIAVEYLLEQEKCIILRAISEHFRVASEEEELLNEHHSNNGVSAQARL